MSSLPTSSEPTTPSSESPLSLDSTLREWLTEALATNASNPKVYTKLLVSNAAAGSIIGKVLPSRRGHVPAQCSQQSPLRCVGKQALCCAAGAQQAAAQLHREGERVCHGSHCCGFSPAPALNAAPQRPKLANCPVPSRHAPPSMNLQAGSNINDVQAKTYARIQLSKANEYFPGTTERTLLVTGRLKQVGMRVRPGTTDRHIQRRTYIGQPLLPSPPAHCCRHVLLCMCRPLVCGACTCHAAHRLATCYRLPAVLQVVAALGLILAKLLREGVAPLR